MRIMSACGFMRSNPDGQGVQVEWAGHVDGVFLFAGVRMVSKLMQTWDADSYAREARFVSELGMPVLRLLAPKFHERILDLGCGDGYLAQQMILMGCDVVGVDSSRELVDAAKARGVDARVMNAQALTFDNEFDAVFSNAALHWMVHLDKVMAGVWRALKAGGRFVVECGGKGNVKAIREGIGYAFARRGLDGHALPKPWHFPDVQETKTLLENAGFVVETIELFERPTPLPGDVSGWVSTFAQDFLASFDAENREDFLNDVIEHCRPKMMQADGTWVADYVRLRFSARKLS